MAFLKQLFYYPYAIRVEILTNSWTTPKSLAHAIQNIISVFCPTEVEVTLFYVTCVSLAIGEFWGKISLPD